jgi:hypothetical protein
MSSGYKLDAIIGPCCLRQGGAVGLPGNPRLPES